MGFWKYLWMGYNIGSNPNKFYKRGWNDGYRKEPRHLYRLAFISKFHKRYQTLYDKGYKDGQHERLIHKI